MQQIHVCSRLDFYKWHEYAEHNSHQLWQEHLVINSRYNIGDSDYMERLFNLLPQPTGTTGCTNH
ncbi:hypothetical protein NXX60_18390 [Bacteroides thetaiotaomicron]|nr:hypothetical protein NXX60_18390 [Bacteroides thetaiotaomicron]